MISHGKSILNRTLCLTLSVSILANLTWQSGSLEKYVGDTCRDDLSSWITQSVRHAWIWSRSLSGPWSTSNYLRAAHSSALRTENWVITSVSLASFKFLASKPVITGHIVHSWVWNARALGRRSKGNDYPSWRLRSCHRNCSVHRNIITAVKRLNFTESGLPIGGGLPYYNESELFQILQQVLTLSNPPRLISLSCL